MLPDFWITGLPHSGTTYVFSLLKALGFETTEDLKWLNARKGGEWWPAFRMAEEFVSALGLPFEPKAPGWNRVDRATWLRVAEEFKPRLLELDWPRVVKIPDYGVLKWVQLLEPAEVILLQRERDSWVRSMKSNGHAAKLGTSALHKAYDVGMASHLNALEFGMVSHVKLQFPAIRYSSQVAWESLKMLIDLEQQEFERIWEQVTR